MRSADALKEHLNQFWNIVTRDMPPFMITQMLLQNLNGLQKYVVSDPEVLEPVKNAVRELEKEFTDDTSQAEVKLKIGELTKLVS